MTVRAEMNDAIRKCANMLSELRSVMPDFHMVVLINHEPTGQTAQAFLSSLGRENAEALVRFAAENQDAIDTVIKSRTRPQ